MTDDGRPPISSWPSLVARAAADGLAVRGAFHPQPPDLGLFAAFGEPIGTCVLLGFTGAAQWTVFSGSREAADGGPDPLDRWSRRVVDALAAELGAVAAYPFGERALPFQRLALRCEPVHPSPIGLLIHPEWGLWHAYRGALLLRDRWEIPAAAGRPRPCDRCRSQPCLTSCPVGAFGAEGYDVAVCTRHVASPAGSDCRERGCLARRACPVGAEHRYGPPQARFHMEAFLGATREKPQR